MIYDPLPSPPPSPRLQGKHLALLPVEPQIGKALVLGCMLGCLDPVLTIAALLSQRNPFVMPMSKKEQADQAKRRFAQVMGGGGGGGSVGT